MSFFNPVKNRSLAARYDLKPKTFVPLSYELPRIAIGIGIGIGIDFGSELEASSITITISIAIRMEGGLF